MSGPTTQIYTVDLGNGHQVDIEGPPNATPEQLHQAVSADPTLAPMLPQQQAAPAGPVQIPGTSAATPDGAPNGYIGGLADQLPKQAAFRLSPEDEAQFSRMAHTADLPTLQAFLDARHASTPGLAAFVAARDKAIAAGHPEVVHTGMTYMLPKVAPGDVRGALNRGAADTLTFGTHEKVSAAIQASKDARNGGDFWGSYARNLDLQNATTESDESNHPIARGIGEITAAGGLPTGMDGVGLEAGTAVLRAGGSIAEARSAARMATAVRASLVGGGYGAAHGAGSADNLKDAGVGALTQGSLGAVIGPAAEGVGNVLSSALEKRAAARLAAAKGKPDYLDIAQRYSIDPTPATVGGAGSQVTQMALGNVPGAVGPTTEAVARENQGLASAVRSVADSTGRVTSRDAAGQALVQGAKDYQASSSRAGGDLYDTANGMIGGDAAPVTLDKTVDAARDFSKQYPTSKSLEELLKHPVVRDMVDMARDAAPKDGTGLPPEVSLSEATDALSHVRAVYRQMTRAGQDPDTVVAQVAKVKDALTADVHRAAGAADIAAGRVPGDEGSALAAQKAADQYWADRKTALAGTLKLPLKSAKSPTEVPAERVYNQLLGDAQRPEKGGNLQRLRDAWFRLPEDARSTFAATSLDDMGRATSGQQNSAGDEWSFNTFLTNFDRMSPQARNIMYGVDGARQLNDLAAYASRLRDVAKARNFSNTAKHLVAASTLTGALGALWHGDVSSAAEIGVGIPVAANMAARVFLATPAMRLWTRRALAVSAKAASSGVDVPGATMQALAESLTPIARTQPQIANQVLQLQQRLTEALSSVPTRVAADKRDDHRGVVDGQGGNK